MKVHLHFDFEKTRIDEVVDAANPEAVVAEVKERVAKRAGFLVGTLIRGMTPLAFAQEATRRYAVLAGETMPPPATCADFVRLAVERKFATLLEE
ncbi:MAG: hypothetical protein SFU56_03740 [Capsulimonadales bacterium]|nr:hypothetical protein [Capsulimonadales bacterium]